MALDQRNVRTQWILEDWNFLVCSLGIYYQTDKRRWFVKKTGTIFSKFRYECVTWYHCCSTLRSILLVLFLMFEYFIHMSTYQNCFQPILLWHFFYFSFCLLLYCMVLYLDALVGGCYCQKWPSKNVNSYNWLLVVIKGLFIGFDFWTTDFSL